MAYYILEKIIDIVTLDMQNKALENTEIFRR